LGIPHALEWTLASLCERLTTVFASVSLLSVRFIPVKSILHHVLTPAIGQDIPCIPIPTTASVARYIYLIHPRLISQYPNKKRLKTSNCIYSEE